MKLDAVSLELVARAAGGDLITPNGSAAADVTVRSIALDSRSVTQGAVFFALPGTRSDGRRFAADAVDRGAAAVVAESRVESLKVPQIVVPNARRALAMIARQWAGSPDEALRLVAVTGTNGKTTCARLIETMMHTAGTPSASLGTLGITLNGEEVALDISRPTTPEAHELRLALRELRNRGAELVAMEASSHAMELDRVWGLRFDAAVFTNLTEDHLDFHGSLEAYFAAKARLFEELDGDALAVINADDSYARRLPEATDARVITYGWSEAADVRPAGVLEEGPIRGEVATPFGPFELELPLVGRFNAANALAVTATGIGLGLSPQQIADGLAAARPVPGRFEPVDAGQDFTVVVDYAHTPDALENVLLAARQIVAARSGRVVCVMGCGGDRDRLKRPLMGAISTKLADMTIFTSDNPRTEDPEAILDEVINGSAEGTFERIEPRTEAIRRAIDVAQPGDLVLIAGKGHEPYQEIHGVKHPFDDRVEARKALAARSRSEGGNTGTGT